MSNLLTFMIDGVDKSSTVVFEGTRLTLKRNNWNQLSLKLKDTHGAGVIQLINARSGQNLFYGILQSEKLEFLSNDKHLLSATFADFDIIFTNWDQYNYDFSAGDHTEKQILADTLGLIAYPCNPIGAHVINGSLVAPKFSNTSLRRLLDDLAAINDRYWYWDGDAELHYFANTGEAAPFNLSDSPNNITTFPYGELTTMQSLGTNNETIYGGSLICWKDGLWPGMAITISNAHLPWVAQSFIVNEVEINYSGGIDAKAIEYKIQFGDITPPRMTDLIARSNQGVSTTDRGLLPPLENDASKYFRSDGVYGVPAGAVPKLDDCGTPDDNTDLNASTSRHGLLKKLSNVATEFMNGAGNWSVPAGGTPASSVQDERSYGQVPIVGVSTNYARQDHTHGSPAVVGTSMSIFTAAQRLRGSVYTNGGNLRLVHVYSHSTSSGGLVTVYVNGALAAKAMDNYDGASVTFLVGKNQQYIVNYLINTDANFIWAEWDITNI